MELTNPVLRGHAMAVTPWVRGEVYAVAANWSDAAAPIYRWTDDGWRQTGRQVADYRHDAAAALVEELVEELVACGQDREDATREAWGLAEEFEVIE